MLREHRQRGVVGGEDAPAGPALPMTVEQVDERLRPLVHVVEVVDLGDPARVLRHVERPRGDGHDRDATRAQRTDDAESIDVRADDDRAAWHRCT